MSSIKILFSLFFVLAFFTIISNTSLAAASAENGQHVAIRLLPEKTLVKGGDSFTVGIEQTIEKGWHTYWINPGDSGTTAKIAWTGVNDITAAPIQWPAPKKLPMGPLTNFGYEDNVILLQEITLPQELPEGPIPLNATIDILVCHDICIPETHSVTFTINGDEDAVPAAIEMARGKLPIDMGWETTLRAEGGNLIVDVLTDTPKAFAKLDTIELYPEEWGLIVNTAKTTATIEEGKLILSHPLGERSLADVPVSKLLIAYNDASGNRKSVRVSTINETMPTSTVVPSGDVGIVKAIFLAILGGLILNLMPCVFPVLSMKALSLVALKDKELSKARIHGLAYTAGIILSFAVIAGILIALKAGGAQIGWGFQLQNPAIILFLAYLFFTLGLNLSGYFDINFGLANAGESLTRKNNLSASFFTGVLATIVATPCTAPFMGVAMGYALTQPAFISLLVFIALGLGLALPYLALTFIPALRHHLPRPGHWMETFRQFLAFPMFASSCWLVWVLSQQTDHMGILIALLGLLAIVFGLWLLKSRPTHHLGSKIVLALAILMFGFALSTLVIDRHIDPATLSSDMQSSDNWEMFSQSKLDEYIEAGEPVFINMTAAWCITCKVNEKVALAIPSTKQIFADRNIKYLKGDWTNQNPEITKFLETYGRSGVPIYVYYAPRNEETGQTPEPVVLPQILTPGIVEKIILGE